MKGFHFCFNQVTMTLIILFFFGGYAAVDQILAATAAGPNIPSSCSGDCAPSGASGRYVDDVCSSLKITKNVPYSQSIDERGILQTHFMDIYEPVANDEAKRPVVIWVHGGGFKETANGRSSETAKAHAIAYAKRCYVTAAIDYRTRPGGVQTKEDPQIVYDAQYDAEAAVRYLRKDAATENKYRMDTDRIAVGGSSAGAVTSLYVGYNSDKPWAERVRNNESHPGYPSHVQAVIDVSGSIMSGLMRPEDPPVFIAHGTTDPLVPYPAAQAIEREAFEKNIPYEFHSFQGAGHTKDLPKRMIVEESADFLYRYLIKKQPPAPAPGDNDPGHDNNLCGNGNIDPGEQCDGENFNGKSCPVEGSLSCTSQCTLDVSACPFFASRQCSDGKDNDGDGHIDYPKDPGCANPMDKDETDRLRRF